MHGIHILHGIIHDKWENHIDEHVDELANLLGLDRDILDFSTFSLEMVEGRILSRWSNKSFQEQQESLFSPLLAYAGEIVRRSVCGEWLIIEDKNTGTLEPWIVDEYRRRYDIIRLVHPFMDDLNSLCLKARVEVTPKLPQK
ncbi:hypothetical protein DTL21_06255 [Bremerella cremea]|uniref:Uncharacterized protein n=1 Tax=Blastopirellula marina TaxID=124 RepID=A0A2S8FZD2_9BACT|nr:hypothetical protein C5Y83_06255 [Blastopirellula marina]RCS49930.1 hypothetical protein DTL21_06255 [Bremerella cremea]